MQLSDVLTEYLWDCKVRRLSEKTIFNYGNLLRYTFKYLEDEFGITRVEDVTKNHLKRFLSYKEKEGRKPYYINDLLKVMKTFFRYCHEEGYIAYLPTEKIHNVKQPKLLLRTFDGDEVLRMLNYFKGHDFISIRNHTILSLFFDTGMRLNEVISLKEEQIHDDYIIVFGKGSKERVVPVSPYVAKHMMKYKCVKEAYCKTCRIIPQQNLFFVSYRGKKLTGEAVTQFMKTAAKAVHVRPEVRVSPHTCRHTFAHMQLKNGCDIYTLSRLMGHENIMITQRYLDGIMDDEILNSVDRVGILSRL